MTQYFGLKFCLILDMAPYVKINVSTELEITSDARQNGGKARYVKHCKYA